MCGVGAIVALPGAAGAPIERAALLRMAAALEHRGPDGFGLYRSARVGLVHTRLAIVDLAGGAQPLANEAEDVWVAFNGEIFNHVELRAELEAKGHAFRTRSDTEVIVHAWEEWGEDAFARFNGQWAVVLVDEPRGRIVLARDRVGVRPLHLAVHAGRLLVASEAKAIFAAEPTLPRRVDPVSVAEALTFWAPLAPHTMFEGVAELTPGAVRVLELATGAHRERRVDRPAYPPSVPAFDGSLDDAVGAVDEALRRAVELRVTRADVPVASYLSGGLDSAYVAALAQRSTGGRLQTFSVRFASPEFDETRFQEEASSTLETEHRAITVDDAAIAAIFPDVVEAAEKTLLRSAPAPLRLLSRLVRASGVKVVLTGEGADETFAGYDLFREGKVRRFWAKRPESTLRPRLLERLYPYLVRSPSAQRAMARAFFGRDLARHGEPGFAHGPRWASAAALQRLLTRDAQDAWARSGRGVDAVVAELPPDFHRWSPLAQDQYLEIETLLSPYILSSQGDRMLMANSVEGRFPFLDAEVMRLANRLPAAYKLRVLDEKHVLKRAARGQVPASILARKKQPYRAPNASAFLGASEPEWVRAVTSPDALAGAGIFDADAVGPLFAKVRAALVRDPRAALSNADDMGVLAVLSTQLLAAAPAPPREAPSAPLVRDVTRAW
jgi:asparagine synthase (glutamine-hydrolysing)